MKMINLGKEDMIWGSRFEQENRTSPNVDDAVVIFGGMY